MSLTSTYVSNVRSSWIFDTQKAWEAESTKIKSRLDTAVSGLSSNAYECFKAKASSEYPDFFNYLYPQNSIVNSSSSVSIKTLVKYAAVGALLGVVVYGLYVIWLFLYSKRIVTTADYTDALGLRVLLSTKGSPEELRIAATKITAACTKQQIKKLALISTDGKSEECIDVLNSILAENGLNVSCISGFLSDYKEMGNLLDVGNCVIIESIGSSLYASVCDEVDLCNDNGVNIIGLINIDK